MSYDPLLDLSNQLCYVHCSFCNTLLLVGAPCNSLLRAELTVICGHCQTLLRVKIGGASFFPLQLVASPHEDSNMNEAVGGRENDNGEKHEITPTRPRVAVNKPPEKRQRAASAYNQFMR
ncbi:crabs claw [Zostera marina]|uniref:Crabs claw n=1 Tax=Zostera marina TaxID=29655 RepID=A0A0K9NZU0_ZOSMR|nr:crabs claw [Zostera marina]